MTNLFSMMLALDSFLFNWVCLGDVYPGEYASSAAYRMFMQGRWQGKVFLPIIEYFFGVGHCYSSWYKQSTTFQAPHIFWPGEPR